MPSFYSVVQVTPNPIVDERINVAVLVFGDGRVRSRIVENWQRVRVFANHDIRAIRRVVTELINADEDKIQKASNSWINSVQITKPRASLESPAKLLDYVAGKFLIDPPLPQTTFFTHRNVVDHAKRDLKRAIRAAVGTPNKWFRETPLKGELGEHNFDIVVGNGEPILAAQGISFEVPAGRGLRKSIDAAAWAADDVKRRVKQFPLSIVARPPKEKTNIFESAKRTFRSIGIPLILTSETSDWATNMADLVASHGSSA